MSNTQAIVCSNCGVSATGAKFCPECGTSVADALRAVPDTETTQSLDFISAAEPAAARRRPWVLVLLTAAAVAGLLVGSLGVWLAVGATHKQQQLSSKVASMAAQVNRQSAHIKAQQSQLDSTANAASIAGVRDQVAKINGTLAHYKNCIPEIQTELDGLTIDYNIDWNDGSQDYFNVDNSNQISNDCNSVLYPR